MRAPVEVDIHGQAAREVEEACRRIRQAGCGTIEAGMVLGSGLSFLADHVEDAVVVPYASIPGFPRPTVRGHAGNFVVGRLEGVPIGIAQGRFHGYEGYDPAAVVLPVRVLHALGARFLFVTNAAGSLDIRNPPGTPMAIRDQINLQFSNPLIGRPLERIHEPFPDMSGVFDRDLRARLHEVALAERILLREGVYAAVHGPSYETPAEVRFLRRIGVDAVGMSTVGETITAAELGLPVVGISLLSNYATGLSTDPLTHEEVTETAQRSTEPLERLIRGFLQACGKDR